MERTGVFISHAHEDHELAQSVRRLLEVALRLAPSDMTCTSDADNALERGDELMEQIRHRLKSARALFLLATPAAERKDWVSFECGFAERERDAGHLGFYVLTPTRGHLKAVPLPYKGRIAVTLSDGCDLHAFVKQLRKAFGASDVALGEGYVDALLDLERRCAALELDGARTEFSGELREAVARHQKLASATRWRLPLSFAVGVALAGMLGWWQVTNTRSRLDADYLGRLEREKTALSGQIRDVQHAMREELLKLPFDGVIQDGSLRPLPCITVEALVPDGLGGERTVPEDCDRGGLFAFSGPQLNSDPRDSIKLRVWVDKAGKDPYTVSLTRSKGRLAINVPGSTP